MAQLGILILTPIVITHCSTDWSLIRSGLNTAHLGTPMPRVTLWHTRAQLGTFQPSGYTIAQLGALKPDGHDVAQLGTRQWLN